MCGAAPLMTQCMTQVTIFVVVVVSCILLCGSREASVVTAALQKNSAPANWSVLGSFLQMKADISTH